jgi:hypothetical protein
MGNQTFFKVFTMGVCLTGCGSTGEGALLTLGVAAVATAGLQLEVAGPAILTSGVLSGVSAVTGVAANLLDSNTLGAAEELQSVAPTVAGAATTAVLTAAKVPIPIAQQLGVAVEGFGTILEKTDDRVNGDLDEN